MVVKKYNHWEDIIIIVYFGNGSYVVIRSNSLRHNIKILLHAVVCWNYIRKQKVLHHETDVKFGNNNSIHVNTGMNMQHKQPCALVLKGNVDFLTTKQERFTAITQLSMKYETQSIGTDVTETIGPNIPNANGNSTRFINAYFLGGFCSDELE
uniref:Uncharacterized protein n=1 Tax=Glossina austeni TaxID=7395 RepID=A0A1A9UMA6_GLOAU